MIESGRLASVQHHSPLQPPSQLTHVGGIEDVVLERHACPAELVGDVGLVCQILAGQAADLLFQLGQLGGCVGVAEYVHRREVIDLATDRRQRLAVHFG